MFIDRHIERWDKASRAGGFHGGCKPLLGGGRNR